MCFASAGSAERRSDRLGVIRRCRPAARDTHPAGHQLLAFRRLGHVETTERVQPLSERKGESHRHVLNHDDGQREGRRQALQDSLERRGPAGGRADDAEVAVRGDGRVQRRPRAARPDRRRRRRTRAGDDLLQHLPPQGLEIHHVEAGLVDELDRSGRERLHRGLGPLAGVGRQHDDLQTRVPAQQPAQDLDAVHPGHRHVERDEIGIQTRNALEGLEPVRRLAYHPVARLRIQDAGERPAHEGGIIHDEDANHEAGIPLR